MCTTTISFYFVSLRVIHICVSPVRVYLHSNNQLKYLKHVLESMFFTNHDMKSISRCSIFTRCSLRSFVENVLVVAIILSCMTLCNADGIEDERYVQYDVKYTWSSHEASNELTISHDMCVLEPLS